MKSIKFLNAVLSVIAFCLVLITLSITGLFPTANASPINNKKVALIPVNEDGSITVKFSKNETLDVNIEEINGYSVYGSAIKVDIDEVGGYSTYGKVPVQITR